MIATEINARVAKNEISEKEVAVKKLAIMQPYFLPYIGYFQLFKAADEFIIYDNIEYTKKGWINRNQFVLNGKTQLFSIPLEKSSDYLDVVQKIISPEFEKERKKILAQIHSGYRKAPEFKNVYPLIEEVFMHDNKNLFEFTLHSVQKVTAFLGINIPIKVSSKFDVDHSLKGSAKVRSLAKAANADYYINPIGGQCLYSVDEFKADGIDLKFHNYRPIPYTQVDVSEFISHMSIIDVLMNNSPQQVQVHLQSYEVL